MLKHLLSTTAAVAIAAPLATLFGPPVALADVAIGIDTGSGFQQVAFDPGTTTAFTGTADGFSFNVLTAAGPTPNPLDSTSLNISSLDGLPNSIRIYVSANDATLSGAIDLLSSLTSNVLPDGWTNTISTYASNTNVLFATTTPLASNLFTTAGTTQEVDVFNADGSWSATGIYDITATSVNTALSTLTIRSDTTPISEPGSLALIGASLAGMGLALRKRHKGQPKGKWLYTIRPQAELSA